MVGSLPALLRARRERPCGGSAADQRDEVAPSNLTDHSMTSSARASSVGGTSRPSALAVLRLMTSSYLVGAVNIVRRATMLVDHVGPIKARTQGVHADSHRVGERSHLINKSADQHR